MEITLENQIEIAEVILDLEANISEITQLTNLKRLVSLILPSVSSNSDILVYLSEYLYEVVAVANGEEDNGWKDEFKLKLLNEIIYHKSKLND